MSRVDSTYPRIHRDLYRTPAWVTQAVIPHLPQYAKTIWEPACGDGAIAQVLVANCYNTIATDIVDGDDFFAYTEPRPEWPPLDGIVTNPPYTQVEDFLWHAICLMKERRGFVAFLLSADFDSAKTRHQYFADCPMFAKTIVLTKRIVWFERTDGKKAQPSENHRWYIWSWRHKGPPTIAYAP